MADDQNPNPLPEIPHHLIFQEILPKLPAKSLIKFKSVAKKWNFVISSVKFSKTHLLHHSHFSPTKSVLTLEDNDSDNPQFEAVEVVENRILDSNRYSINIKGPYTMLSSCNGLVLLISSDRLGDCYFRHLTDFNYVVYNPVLGADHFVSVRPASRFPRADKVICDYNFGFGYVSSRDDYYIVALNFPHGSEIVAHVYSLRSQRWMTRRKPLSKQLTPLSFRNQWYDDTGTLVADTLYWGVTTDMICDFILAYNLASYQDKPPYKVKLPRTNFGDYFSLCCLKGCLCAWASDEEGEVAEMWMLKDYGAKKSWIKLFCFHSNRYFCNRFFGYTMPKVVLGFANRVELILVDFSYDPPVISDDVLYGVCEAVSYIPSLVSVFALISEPRD